MSRTRALLSAAVLFLSLSAFAWASVKQDVSGNWQMSIQTPDGSLGALMSIAQSGDTITGNVQSELGAAPFSGRVKGDTLSFALSLDANGQFIEVNGNAVVSGGNTMNGQLIVAGMGGMPFSARKQQ